MSEPFEGSSQGNAAAAAQKMFSNSQVVGNDSIISAGDRNGARKKALPAVVGRSVIGQPLTTTIGKVETFIDEASAATAISNSSVHHESTTLSTSNSHLTRTISGTRLLPLTSATFTLGYPRDSFETATDMVPITVAGTSDSTNQDVAAAHRNNVIARVTNAASRRVDPNQPSTPPPPVLTTAKSPTEMMLSNTNDTIPNSVGGYLFTPPFIYSTDHPLAQREALPAMGLVGNISNDSSDTVGSSPSVTVAMRHSSSGDVALHSTTHSIHNVMVPLSPNDEPQQIIVDHVVHISSNSGTGATGVATTIKYNEKTAQLSDSNSSLSTDTSDTTDLASGSVATKPANSVPLPDWRNAPFQSHLFRGINRNNRSPWPTVSPSHTQDPQGTLAGHGKSYDRPSTGTNLLSNDNDYEASRGMAAGTNPGTATTSASSMAKSNCLSSFTAQSGSRDSTSGLQINSQVSQLSLSTPPNVFGSRIISPNNGHKVPEVSSRGLRRSGLTHHAMGLDTSYGDTSITTSNNSPGYNGLQLTVSGKPGNMHPSNPTTAQSSGNLGTSSVFSASPVSSAFMSPAQDIRFKTSSEDGPSKLGRDYMCPVCKQEFGTLALYEAHRQGEGPCKIDTAPGRCPYCDRQFKGIRGLNIHLGGNKACKAAKHNAEQSSLDTEREFGAGASVSNFAHSRFDSTDNPLGASVRVVARKQSLAPQNGLATSSPSEPTPPASGVGTPFASPSIAQPFLFGHSMSALHLGAGIGGMSTNFIDATALPAGSVFGNFEASVFTASPVSSPGPGAIRSQLYAARSITSSPSSMAVSDLLAQALNGHQTVKCNYCRSIVLNNDRALANHRCVAPVSRDYKNRFTSQFALISPQSSSLRFPSANSQPEVFNASTPFYQSQAPTSSSSRPSSGAREEVMGSETVADIMLRNGNDVVSTFKSYVKDDSSRSSPVLRTGSSTRHQHLSHHTHPDSATSDSTPTSSLTPGLLGLIRQPHSTTVSSPVAPSTTTGGATEEALYYSTSYSGNPSAQPRTPLVNSGGESLTTLTKSGAGHSSISTGSLFMMGYPQSAASPDHFSHSDEQAPSKKMSSGHSSQLAASRVASNEALSTHTADHESSRISSSMAQSTSFPAPNPQERHVREALTELYSRYEKYLKNERPPPSQETLKNAMMRISQQPSGNSSSLSGSSRPNFNITQTYAISSPATSPGSAPHQPVAPYLTVLGSLAAAYVSTSGDSSKNIHGASPSEHTVSANASPHPKESPPRESLQSSAYPTAAPSPTLNRVGPPSSNGGDGPLSSGNELRNRPESAAHTDSTPLPSDHTLNQSFDWAASGTIYGNSNNNDKLGVASASNSASCPLQLQRAFEFDIRKSISSSASVPQSLHAQSQHTTAKASAFFDDSSAIASSLNTELGHLMVKTSGSSTLVAQHTGSALEASPTSVPSLNQTQQLTGVTLMSAGQLTSNASTDGDGPVGGGAFLPTPTSTTKHSTKTGYLPPTHPRLAAAYEKIDHSDARNHEFTSPVTVSSSANYDHGGSQRSADGHVRSSSDTSTEGGALGLTGVVGLISIPVTNQSSNSQHLLTASPAPINRNTMPNYSAAGNGTSSSTQSNYATTGRSKGRLALINVSNDDFHPRVPQGSQSSKPNTSSQPFSAISPTLPDLPFSHSASTVNNWHRTSASAQPTSLTSSQHLGTSKKGMPRARSSSTLKLSTTVHSDGAGNSLISATNAFQPDLTDLPYFSEEEHASLSPHRRYRYGRNNSSNEGRIGMDMGSNAYAYGGYFAPGDTPTREESILQPYHEGRLNNFSMVMSTSTHGMPIGPLTGHQHGSQNHSTTYLPLSPPQIPFQHDEANHDRSDALFALLDSRPTRSTLPPPVVGPSTTTAAAASILTALLPTFQEIKTPFSQQGTEPTPVSQQLDTPLIPLSITDGQGAGNATMLGQALSSREQAAANGLFDVSIGPDAGAAMPVIFTDPLAPDSSTPTAAKPPAVLELNIDSLVEKKPSTALSNLLSLAPTPLSAIRDLLKDGDAFSFSPSSDTKKSTNQLTFKQDALVDDPLLADDHGLCYDLNPAPTPERSTIQSLIPLFGVTAGNSTPIPSTPPPVSASPIGAKTTTAKSLEVVKVELDDILTAKTRRLMGKKPNATTLTTFGKKIFNPNQPILANSMTNVSGLAVNDPAHNPTHNASLPADSNAHTVGSPTNVIPAGSVTAMQQASITHNSKIGLSTVTPHPRISAKLQGMGLTSMTRQDTASPLTVVSKLESTAVAPNPARQLHANRRRAAKRPSFARSSAGIDDDIQMDKIEPVLGVGQAVDRMDTPPSMGSSLIGKFPSTINNSAANQTSSANASMSPLSPPKGFDDAVPPELLVRNSSAIGSTTQPTASKATKGGKEMASSLTTSHGCPVIHMPSFPISSVMAQGSTSSINTTENTAASIFATAPAQRTRSQAALTTVTSSNTATNTTVTHDGAAVSDNTLFSHNTPQPIVGHDTHLVETFPIADEGAICSTPASPHFHAASTTVFGLPQLATISLERQLQSNVTPTQTYLNAAALTGCKTALPVVTGPDSAFEGDATATTMYSADNPNPLGTSSNFAYSGLVGRTSSTLFGPSVARSATLMPRGLSASELKSVPHDADTLETLTASLPFTATSNPTVSSPGECKFPTVIQITNSAPSEKVILNRLSSFGANSSLLTQQGAKLGSFVSSTSLKCSNTSEVIDNNTSAHAKGSKTFPAGYSSSFLSNFDNSKNEPRRVSHLASSPNNSSPQLQGAFDSVHKSNPLESTGTYSAFAASRKSRGKDDDEYPLEIQGNKEDVSSIRSSSTSSGTDRTEDEACPQLLVDLVKVHKKEGDEAIALEHSTEGSFTAQSVSLENERNVAISLEGIHEMLSIPYVAVTDVESKAGEGNNEASTTLSIKAGQSYFSSSARDPSDHALPHLRKTSNASTTQNIISVVTPETTGAAGTVSPIPLEESAEDYWDVLTLGYEDEHYTEEGKHYDELRLTEVERDFNDYPSPETNDPLFIVRRFYDTNGSRVDFIHGQDGPDPREIATDSLKRYKTLKMEEVIPVGPFYVEVPADEKSRHDIASEFWASCQARSESSTLASPRSFHAAGENQALNNYISTIPNRHNSTSLKTANTTANGSATVNSSNDLAAAAKSSSGSGSTYSGLDSLEPAAAILTNGRGPVRRKNRTSSQQPSPIITAASPSTTFSGQHYVSNPYIAPRRFPKRRHYLLPPQCPQHQGLITLVLDLDETLVSAKRLNQAEADAFKRLNNPPEVANDVEALPSIVANFDAVIEVKTELYAIYFRPHMLEFLLSAAQTFEVVLFSAGIRDYVDAIANEIQRVMNDYCSALGHQCVQLFHHRLYRHHCVRKRFFHEPVPKPRDGGGGGCTDFSTTGAGFLDTAQQANELPVSAQDTTDSANKDALFSGNEEAKAVYLSNCLAQKNYLTKWTSMMGRDMDRIVFIDNSPFAVEDCQQHAVSILDYMADIVWENDVTRGLPCRLEKESPDGPEKYVLDEQAYHWTRDDHLAIIWENVLWPLVQPQPQPSTSSPSPASSNVFSGNNNNSNGTNHGNFETCSNVAGNSLGVRLPSFSGHIHSHHYRSCTRGVSTGNVRSTSPSIGDPSNIIQSPTAIEGNRSEPELPSSSSAFTIGQAAPQPLYGAKISPHQHILRKLQPGTSLLGAHQPNEQQLLRMSTDSKSGGIAFIPHPSRQRNLSVDLLLPNSIAANNVMLQLPLGSSINTASTTDTVTTILTHSTATTLSASEQAARKALNTTIDEGAVPRPISPADNSKQPLTPIHIVSGSQANNTLPRPILGPSLDGLLGSQGMSREQTFDRDEDETVFVPYKKCELSATSILTTSTNYVAVSEVHSQTSKFVNTRNHGQLRQSYPYPTLTLPVSNNTGANAFRTPSIPSSPVTTGTSVATLTNTTTTTTTTTTSTTATSSKSGGSSVSKAHSDIQSSNGAFPSPQRAARHHHFIHQQSVADGSGSDPLSGEMSDDDRLSYHTNGSGRREASSSRGHSSAHQDSNGNSAGDTVMVAGQMFPIRSYYPGHNNNSVPASFGNSKNGHSSAGPTSFFSAGPPSLTAANGSLFGGIGATAAMNISNVSPTRPSPLTPSNAAQATGSSASSYRAENRGSVTASTVFSQHLHQSQRCHTPAEHPSLLQQSSHNSQSVPQSHHASGNRNPSPTNNNSISSPSTAVEPLTSRNFRTSVLKLIQKTRERNAQLWDKVLSETGH